MTPERWRLISAVFDAAMARDAATRGGFLEEACADDRELRTEVEALLDAHYGAGVFGEQPIRVFAPADAPRIVAGAALGPYCIEALLGAGGMGEVYKATDTRLGRPVAIKILPEHVAADEQSRQRFEREARTVAALSHPHICPLFDVGEQNGIRFLVMEYLEGRTLADRLKSGALPQPEALRYAVQIADALDKAHRRGIVHRDLKPANIMLTPTGAKLLDFGLAKSHAGGPNRVGGSSDRAAPGETLTGQGSLLGTLPYMSPEQVQCQDTDSRTDIFAFGAILYEMVVGRRAFEAPTQALLIEAILEEEVSPSSDRQLPPALDRLVRRCLAKDPEERWQSAGDMRHELQSIGEQPVMDFTPAESPHRPDGLRTSERSGWAAAVLAVGTAAAWIAVADWRSPPTPMASQVVRFPVSLPAGLRLVSRPTSVPIAVSPLGNQIIFSAIDPNDAVQLYVRETDRSEVRPLPGTEGGFAPFFSPDGSWLGFAAGEALKKMPLPGGPVVTIADAVLDDQFGGATWSADGTIVFAPTRAGGLSTLPATGGVPRVLTVPDAAKGEVSHLLPQFLPGGRAVLFTLRAGLNVAPSRIEVVRIATSERRVVAESGINARYIASGHVVFGGDGLLAGSLWAVPFDTGSLRTTGPEIRVLDSLMAPAGLAFFTLTESGTLVSVPRQDKAPQELVLVDATGQSTTLADASGTLLNPRLSPDNKRVALTRVSEGDPRSGVWLIDRARPQSPLLFSNQSRSDHIPVWTPDGTRIVFSSLRNGADRAAPANLYWKRLDGRGDAERLTESRYHQDPGSWSPDARFLTYAEQDPTTRWDIWIMDIRERTARPLVRTPARDITPMVSPDGRWLAYTSDETGRNEVYVVSFPGADQKQRISSAGGDQPLWARDGHRLFYREANKVIAVDVSLGPPLIAGRSEVLFEGTYSGRGGNGAPNYEVSADGRSFLMIRQNDLTSVAQTQLDVALNWTIELGDRARRETGR